MAVNGWSSHADSVWLQARPIAMDDNEPEGKETTMEQEVALWHVLYTRARSEKKVNEYLERRGFTTYLPLHKVRKQWSDRKKWVHEPLFRSYLFVKIIRKEYYEVLMAPGAVKYVYFEGKPAIVPDKQINDLRQLIEHQVPIEQVIPIVHKGDRVRITRGPMMDVEGIMHDTQSGKKVIIQIEGLEQALAITVPLADVEVVAKKARTEG